MWYVHPNCTGMHDFRCQTWKMKQHDIQARIRGNLTKIVQKGRMHIIHMHLIVIYGNFKDEHNSTKPTTIKIYHKHMKYVYKWDEMEIAIWWIAVLSNGWKNCSFICLTQKPILSKTLSCLVRNLRDKVGKLRHLHLLTKGRPSNAAKIAHHHALTNSDHWLVWPVKW